jgi:hypothetical protein
MNGRFILIPCVLVLTLANGCNREPSNSSGPVTVQFGNLDNPPYTQFFQPENPGTAHHITAEGQAVRIALPADATGAPVGLAMRNGIQGDFKIGVTYELLEADAGGADWGSGFQLLLRLVNPGQDAVFVARQARRNGQSVVFQHMTTQDGKRMSKQSKVVAVNPAIARGEFILEREGSQLTVRYGDDGRPEPKLLGAFEVGPEPIDLVRLAANPERGKNPIVVRVLNFNLSTGQIAAGPSGGLGRFNALAIVLVVVLAVGATLWLVRRRLTVRGTRIHPPDAAKS